MPVSEQFSGTHGRAEDDAIKRQDLSELREHGDQWPDPEAEGDNGAVWAPEGRFEPGGAEDWQAIELRSELARRLDRSMFPATRGQLTSALTAADAEQSLLDLVASLPEGQTVSSFGDLTRALGLPVESRGA